jgi:hypothetical protein
MRDNLIPKSRCLNCGEEHTGALDAFGDAKPKPGDFAVCIKCGHIMAYDKKLRLRNPTRREQIAIAGRPELIRVQKLLTLYQREKADERKLSEDLKAK